MVKRRCGLVISYYESVYNCGQGPVSCKQVNKKQEQVRSSGRRIWRRIQALMMVCKQYICQQVQGVPKRPIEHVHKFSKKHELSPYYCKAWKSILKIFKMSILLKIRCVYGLRSKNCEITQNSHYLWMFKVEIQIFSKLVLCKTIKTHAVGLWRFLFTVHYREESLLSSMCAGYVLHNETRKCIHRRDL